MINDMAHKGSQKSLRREDQDRRCQDAMIRYEKSLGCLSVLLGKFENFKAGKGFTCDLPEACLMSRKLLKYRYFLDFSQNLDRISLLNPCQTGFLLKKRILSCQKREAQRKNSNCEIASVVQVPFKYGDQGCRRDQEVVKHAEKKNLPAKQRRERKLSLKVGQAVGTTKGTSSKSSQFSRRFRTGDFGCGLSVGRAKTFYDEGSIKSASDFKETGLKRTARERNRPSYD